MTKPTWLKVLMALGAACTAAAAGATVSLTTGLLIGIPAFATTLAALYHEPPQGPPAPPAPAP